MNKKYQRFVEMNEERRDDIIRAALKEFALYPYERASLNRILTDAHFSKGGLYHYFDGKKDLYMGVAEYIVEYQLNVKKKATKMHSGDIFERMKELGEIQAGIIERYPYYAEFLMRLSYLEKDEMSTDLYELVKQDDEEYVKKLFADIDDSLLKEGITEQEAIIIIRNTIVGYQNENGMKNNVEKDNAEKFNLYRKGLLEVCEILKKILYK